jgi:putative membrane protein
MTDLRPTPLNTINELAKERNRAAAERTLNAWTALCLSLMGFGVALSRFLAAGRGQLPVGCHNPLS